MFDFVRSHSRLMLGLMVLLIFPSFVFFGIQGYSRFTDPSSATVAKVDGQGISRAEWDNAHQRQLERLRQQMPNVDVKLLDNPQSRRQTLDALVQERLLLAAVNKMHLTPSDERLKRLFREEPTFAGLRNPDGTVNKDLLALRGMTSEMLAQQLRLELGMQQVANGLRTSALSPAAAASAALDALLQRREVQYERFDRAAFVAKVQPTDEQIEAYYKANQSAFSSPEQAAIEYVVFDLDTAAKDVTVAEADLRKVYDQVAKNRYTEPEERRASHILIKADRDKPAAEREKAKAKAQALLEEVRKNPASFAEVARKNSEDSSAAQGGDLDFFARGAMVKPFEDAAFALKKGEISSVIETDFGFHVLQVTDARGGAVKPFEAVRGEIEAEERKARAQKVYAEKAEQFTDAVLNQSDSLQPVIDKLKLKKLTATVARAPAPAASGVLASQKFLTAVFTNDVLRDKRNSDAVEVGSNQLAAARVVTYSPTRTLPLAEVKDRVREQVVAREAAALARKEGEARLSNVKESPQTALSNTATVSRNQTQGLPRQAIDAAMRADASKLPAAVGVDLGEQGYVVLRVTKVLPREALPGGDAPLYGQYAQAWSNVEADAYLAALKKRFKVEYKEAVVAQALTAASAASP